MNNKVSDRCDICGQPKNNGWRHGVMKNMPEIGALQPMCEAPKVSEEGIAMSEWKEQCADCNGQGYFVIQVHPEKITERCGRCGGDGWLLTSKALHETIATLRAEREYWENAWRGLELIHKSALARERELVDIACDRAFLAGMGLGWNLGVSEDRIEFNKRREAGYKMIRDAKLSEPADTPAKET